MRSKMVYLLHSNELINSTYGTFNRIRDFSVFCSIDEDLGVSNCT